MPGFARAFVSHTAAQVGVRESRRLVGRYELTRDDILCGRRFPDAVARACWPIELWEPGRLGPTYEYLEDGQSYDIPLRSLQARDIDNLFAAGRCVSATHDALGSARVIGTCLATGDAAGRRAAAMQADASR
jgi:succinate dehydrogenase/fumarate reductase flavoprotein subunit